ncbi:MAG: dihydrolipoamide acetyltransferase [Myxococcales bacterium]|nr:MAG: dihydrolipoamide acetyltransferase [Myxococcales bacterium]
MVRLRDLEQRIDELKEQIRRSHTRLSLLSDTILSGGVGGARAEITFKNDLSSAFRVTGATFVLDGAVQYNKTDESENSALAAQKEIPVFSGSIPPGDHTLQIVLRLRGHGYGVFSYLRGYKFQVPSSHTFTITEGKTLKLDVIGWEKGDVTTALEQRPSIRYVENLRAGVTGEGAPAAAPPAKAEAGGSISVGAGAK